MLLEEMRSGDATGRRGGLSGTVMPPDPSGLVIALDLETTGLQWWKDDAFLMALSYPDGSDYYLDLRDPNHVRWAQDHVHRAAALVNHNLKFDLHFMLKMGIRFPKTLHDTLIYAALIFEHHHAYDLDYIGNRYIGVGKDDSIYQKLSDLFGGKPDKKTQMPNLHKAPLALSAPYAMQDTRTALRLWEWQMGELARQELLPVAEMEMALLPVLLEMEHGGVRVDIARAEEAVEALTVELVANQARLDALVGPLNVNSAPQVRKLFAPEKLPNGWYRLCDGTIAEPTDGGQASVDANCLKRMQHPAAALILEVRVYKKLRDTFMKGHILGSHVNGVVHTTYNQTRTEDDKGTGSGRLSSSAPALQQVSARNQRACEIVRSCFLPDEGTEWLSGDFSQIDFRVMAHFMNDPVVNSTYAADPLTDFHTRIAELTGLPRNPTPTSRACAKTVNLGLAFGMSEGRLAEEMGLPFTLDSFTSSEGELIEYKKGGSEGQALFASYHQALPNLKPLLKKIKDIAKTRGFVKTLMGRRCRFPGGKNVHAAGPYVFQGGAAELMKKKLLEMAAVAPGLGCRLMLTVHDSVELSGPPEALVELKRQFEENTLGMRIPLASEWKHGVTWWETSKK